MEWALVAILVIFLIFLFVETKRKAERIQRAITEEKRLIAEDSGMTASIGVFSPDTQTRVVIGASEQLGVFYYRMLRQGKLIIKSRINLANLARIEFLLNGQPSPVSAESEQPTLSLSATDVAERTISEFSADSIRQVQRAALRVSFYDDTGAEKALEITTFRSNDERQRFERVKLLKNTIWWVSFLQMASRQARHARSSVASAQPDEEK